MTIFKPHLLILLSALISDFAVGKTFSNQYTQFELPPGWSCVIEGSEWVCQAENKDRKKEAIIILAAKYRGKQDSLDQYEAYLKQIKTYQLPGGKVQKSEPVLTKKRPIAGHTWIDALHLASEVPGFYTRYLATVKEDLGVAVTFSVTKDLYQAYQGIFDKVIATLKVFRKKASNTGKLDLSKRENKGANFDDATFVPNGQRADIGMGKKRKRDDDGSGDDDLLILIGAMVVILLILLKIKKNKGKSSGKGKRKGPPPAPGASAEGGDRPRRRRRPPRK